MTLRRAGLLLLAGVLAGCAHPQRGPAEALSDFGAAVDRKDYAAAYALMTADYRKRVAFEDFRRDLDAGGPDVQAAAHRLREDAARTPLQIDVDVDLAQRLTMVLEGGQWRVAAHPFDLYDQATPRAALRSFVRAIETGRYEALLRLTPNRYRVAVTVQKLRDYWDGEHKAENRKRLAELRANIGAPIVETGDEARMPYGDNSEARLVREDGVWKVEEAGY
jgi:hypothetical protein